MSETCIVCLGDLGESASELPLPVAHATTDIDKEPASNDSDVTDNVFPNVSSLVSAQPELIAHLLPCGHNLHDECLKPWVERANSCPICRQNFNMVELVKTIGGRLINQTRCSYNADIVV